MSKKIIIFMVIYTTITFAQEPKTGKVSGKVIDAENKTPLIGVTVFIKDLRLGTITDSEGKYLIDKLPVGAYVLNFSLIGYKNVTVPDIIIKSGRVIVHEIELYSSMLELDSIVIRSGFFSNRDSKTIQTIEFSSEEIRRAPGSVGDVSRILFSLPSLAKINDGKSSLIVRGGSPVENAFYLDNIEINNINHFATQGSSDGFFGILNIDFVKNVKFHSGGFLPIYGDKLSSIMEISFREGNDQQFDSQLNLNFGGLSAQIEGPINQGKSSFLISANMSYLNLVMKAFANDYPAPNYYDFQGKLVYNFSGNSKLTIIDVFADDNYNIPYNKAIEKEMNQYGLTDIVSNNIGLNWLSIWGNNAYSETSVSHSYSFRKINLKQTESQNQFLDNSSIENEIRIRNINFLKISDMYKFDFGVDAKFAVNKFNYTFNSYQNEYGNIIPTNTTIKNLRSIKGGAFVVYNMSLFSNLFISPGFRIDYYDFTKRWLCSPRVLIHYNLSPLWIVRASTGIYYQNILQFILAQSEKYRELEIPKAVHLVFGLSHLLTFNTNITLELFSKRYSNFPSDPQKPKDFLFDEVVSTGMFTSHSSLLSAGEAISRGIELLIQKKLTEDFYGLFSMSYSKVQYKDQIGNWQNRIYDNRFNINLEGGYKPNNEWEFSLRFIYSGGTPYTPFNIPKSSEENMGILDLNRINKERLPDYHSLNIRVDKRFHFESTNLVVFLSVWNVYNRDNISAYTWNEIKNKLVAEIGWNTLPIFGVEYEF